MQYYLNGFKPGDPTDSRPNQSDAPSLVDLPDKVDVLMRAEHAFFVDKGMEDFMVLLAQFAGAGAREERARFRRVVIEQQAPVRQAMVAALEQGMTDGRVAPCDAEALVDLLFVTVDGAMVHAALRDFDPTPVHDFVKTHLLEPLKR